MDYKNTFAFLLELKKNNNKEWFDAKKKRYEAVKKDFAGLIETWIKEVGKFDETVHGLEPKTASSASTGMCGLGRINHPTKPIWVLLWLRADARVARLDTTCIGSRVAGRLLRAV